MYHRNKKVIEAQVKQYFSEWRIVNALKCSIHSFKGVSFHHLPQFEDTFKINVNMYELAPDDSDVIIPRFLSQENHSETMYINLYQNHTSYIKNFSAYSGKLQCPSCFRLFSRKDVLRNHMRICSNTKKCRFPGGFFQAQKTIFDELEDFGVFVPENLRLYPYFAVFDFEAMLKKTEDRVSEKLEFTHYHKPISVSLNSNVDGYTEPIHHVSANLDVLLKSMLESLTEIARAAEAKTREKLSFVFDILNERMSKCAPAADLTPTSITTREVESVGYDHDDDDDDDDDINDAITCEDLALVSELSGILQYFSPRHPRHRLKKKSTLIIDCHLLMLLFNCRCTGPKVILTPALILYKMYLCFV